ncbi:hypothetical protein JKP88DRAFT_317124 [Tribonema minus]|uniref:Diphthine--ammonia ligase n=1 Tax=Tribonema minus TaxID=303371 RepID=A0A835YXG3_9STRA|nr:hypothetical protein JKP88DRAFT_317124 [Tribonema minus]
MADKLARDIEDAHKAACDAGEMAYSDPATGYTVFTELQHIKRGFCCGNGCRHCPFLHQNVEDPALRKNGPTKTVLLNDGSDASSSSSSNSGSGGSGSARGGGPLNVLFWSGGKDSFLTLRALQAEQRDDPGAPEVMLITTCDAVSGTVAFQNTNIRDVMDQAKALQVDLLAVPLKGGEASTGAGPYVDAVMAALEPFKQRIRALCFGDLHLVDIRAWREATFTDTYPCRFPLFNTPYAELKARLWAEAERGTISVTVSAVRDDLLEQGPLRIGAQYDAAFVGALPQGVDEMGENGEFHTHVAVAPSAAKAVVKGDGAAR